jgi:hypothetical protein
MFLPCVYAAEAVGLSDDILDNPHQTCMCNKRGSIRNKLVSWTHPVGSEEYSWHVSCDLGCYIANVTGGSC